MGKETSEEEQASQSSEKEQTEESSEPDSFEGYMDRFSEEQAQKESSEETEEEGETGEESETEEKEEASAEEPQAKLFLVDETGKKKIPFIFKADGKDYAPEEAEKALQLASLGVHSNVRVEDVNKREAKLKEVEPFFNAIQKAYKEGRLKIDGETVSPSGGKKEEKEEEQEDVELDVEHADLKKANKELKKDVDELKLAQLKGMMNEARTKLEGQIVAVAKKYPLAILRTDEAAPKEVWELLNKYGDDERPVHSAESAMKTSHESMLKFITNIMEKNPEQFKEYNNKIIANYVKNKGEKEEAPVGSPSEIPASTKTKGEKKKEYKNFDEAMADASIFLKERKKAGQTF